MRSPLANRKAKRSSRIVSLPLWERGTASAALGCSRIMAHLRRSSSLFFIPLSPSNLRPFGAPPSIGRRECPREPLPLEGAAERSEAGLASFWGEAASSLPSPLGKGDRTAVDRVLSQTACLRRSPSLSFIPLVPYPARSARHLPHAGKALCREKRHPRFVAFPIGEGGPRSGG